MITVTEPLTYSIDFDLNRYGKPEEILFFDIETTGLSPEYCTIYLIGCVFYSENSWYLKQFFAESTDAESEILFHFLTMLSKYSVLIHFNGDTFDIPFIKKRAKKLDILHADNSIESLDIYRQIKPFKKLLGLNDCKQKSIELMLGINREDKYNGGQLIEIYKDYLKSHDEEEKRLLLLHNADDLKGLPKLLPILNYSMFFNNQGTLNTIEALLNEASLNICADFTDINLPSLISLKNDNISITAKANTVSINIELLNDELKHYYPDFKNYYYLPDEDIAIHVSVAEFVDKAYRKKATAKTCYTKKFGLFLPCFDEINSALFYKEYPLKKPYMLFDKELITNKDFLTGYFKSILEYIKL